MGSGSDLGDRDAGCLRRAGRTNTDGYIGRFSVQRSAAFAHTPG